MANGVTGAKRIDMRQLMKKSVLLSNYDEDTQREYLVSLAHMYKSARVGSPQFQEICQGRAEPAKASGRLFSTCGEFAMFLLERFGYRGQALNRDLWDQEGNKTRSWKVGKNIEYIFFRGRREGAFVEYLLSKLKGKRPSPGDIIYIGNEKQPRTEHVMMLDGIWVDEHGSETWHTIDAGQGGVRNQHVAEVVRRFKESTGQLYGSGGGRRVIGWLNPVLLPLTHEANLKVPEE